MADLTKPKWYKNKTLLIVLFFILPPLGIYGIIKRKSTGWKTALYIIPATLLTFFSILVVVTAIFMNPYKDGIDYYNKHDYIKAYKQLKMVNSDDPNYNDAILKINEIKPIIDSITKEKENKSGFKIKTAPTKETTKIDLTNLKEFQKKWSDSIVNSWEGSFIIRSKLLAPDTIYFELSKGATKSYNSNRSQNLPMYESNYRKSLNNKFGNLYDSVKTVIDFIPNKELAKSNNSNEWTHPVLMNRGLKIYSGNEYSKDLIGTLSCKFKNKNDGNTYYVILKSNGSSIDIVEYEFRSYYWIRKNDSNYNNANGITKCF
ncbi:hypothetical protein [Flavobacterium gyeonganense]|uniref:Uncharacterized protein n=1 Tax=Flavobacterium gyeonganense TaxID=1310418 RepID=A0ABV5H8C8_9FLAO|nr:hypothetical protein [Flavobacterium gyeonganense]